MDIVKRASEVVNNSHDFVSSYKSSFWCIWCPPSFLLLKYSTHYPHSWLSLAGLAGSSRLAFSGNVEIHGAALPATQCYQYTETTHGQSSGTVASNGTLARQREQGWISSPARSATQSTAAPSKFLEHTESGNDQQEIQEAQVSESSRSPRRQSSSSSREWWEVAPACILGKGTFGDVFLLLTEDTERLHACKTVGSDSLHV